uniref:Nuclear receptor domain-containing protein n=1 Tax=Setaria digitata TaxID=48799 RepID=A0A915Q176_9BILA
MDSRSCGNIWQHGFTLPQANEYHHVEDASIPISRDPIRDATTSSFLFYDYDPAFRANIAQTTATSNFTGSHYIVPLSHIPDSSSGFAGLPVRQMIATTTPIHSPTYPCSVKDFAIPLPTRLSSEQSCSLFSFDASNSLPACPIQQPTPRMIPPVTIRKPSGEQPCQVCLAAASNGLHFGAKTCAACAAFFRRTVSDEKSYTCKRSQRCDVKLNYATGYRKICRSCRMKRCLDVGMLPENVQNKRQRKDYKENYDSQDNDERNVIAGDSDIQSPIPNNDIATNNLSNQCID